MARRVNIVRTGNSLRWEYTSTFNPKMRHPCCRFLRPGSSMARAVLGKFEAPDDLIRRPAFFISETLYPGETCGYVSISEISSVGSGTYTTTLAKKIAGTSTADVEQKGKVCAEGKAE